MGEVKGCRDDECFLFPSVKGIQNLLVGSVREGNETQCTLSSITSLSVHHLILVHREVSKATQRGTTSYFLPSFPCTSLHFPFAPQCFPQKNTVFPAFSQLGKTQSFSRFSAKGGRNPEPAKSQQRAARSLAGGGPPYQTSGGGGGGLGGGLSSILS